MDQLKHHFEKIQSKEIALTKSRSQMVSVVVDVENLTNPEKILNFQLRSARYETFLNLAKSDFLELKKNESKICRFVAKKINSTEKMSNQHTILKHGNMTIVIGPMHESIGIFLRRRGNELRWQLPTFSGLVTHHYSKICRDYNRIVKEVRKAAADLLKALNLIPEEDFNNQHVKKRKLIKNLENLVNLNLFE